MQHNIAEVTHSSMRVHHPNRRIVLLVVAAATLVQGCNAADSRCHRQCHGEEFQKTLQEHRQTWKDMSDATYLEISRKLPSSKSVRIGVTAMVGAGKSTYINTMRGLKPSDECAAKVGVIEETSKAMDYPSPDNPCVVFVDLPGYSTPTFPTKTYTEKLKLCALDAVVILTQDKIKTDDHTIYEEVRRCGTPVFYAFSRARSQCESNEEDKGQSCDETKKELRKEARKKGFKTQAYMISARYKDVHDKTNRWADNEYDELRTAIYNSLDQLKRNQLATGMSALVMDRKAKAKARRAKAIDAAWYRAVAAALNQGFNPIPLTGVGGTAAILSEVEATIKNIYGLDDESLQKAGPIAESIAVQVFQGTGAAFGGLAARAAAAVSSDSTKYAPIWGQMWGATVGYTTVMSNAEEMANLCEEAYHKIYDTELLVQHSRHLQSDEL
eukprot:COSAG02_NODE_1040_length_15035_cov_198.613819_5_plen_441_part_00